MSGSAEHFILEWKNQDFAIVQLLWMSLHNIIRYVILVFYKF